MALQDAGTQPHVEVPQVVLVPGLQLEQSLWERGALRVAGVDEVGLGSLCGPVLAAAVLVPAHCEMLEGVRDSKTLSAAQRERLAVEIVHQALAVGVGAASLAEIEQINVRNAAHLAMRRALARIGPYDHALVDGRDTTQIDLGPHTAVVDGDAICYAIACASILAKVARDRLMAGLARRYPGYGWEHNAGYATEEHLVALRALGPTPHHRRSYAPLRALDGGQDVES